MGDEQDRAEALDEDTHDADYPPDEPLGIDDPTQDDRVEDSIEERAAREVPERVAETDHVSERPLVQPYVEEDEALLDDEAELIGEALIDERDPDADSAPAAAEEAALHLED